MPRPLKELPPKLFCPHCKVQLVENGMRCPLCLKYPFEETESRSK